MINKTSVFSQVVILEQFQVSMGVDFEFFFDKKTYSPTVLINSIIHNKSMVPPLKLNIEFS